MKSARSIGQGVMTASTVAIVAALTAAAARAIATRYSPFIEWLLLFGFLLLLIRMAHMNELAARMRLAQNVVELDDSMKTLALEKRRSEVILANMADGIIVVDRDMNVTLFNDTAAHFFDEPGSAAIGKQLMDTSVHPEVTRLAYECFECGQPLSSEIRLPGWPQKVISLRATSFASPAGDCGMVILRDLTELKRHERNQKEFVGNVSHELRTPITAIRTTAEALLSGAKNDGLLVDQFLNSIIAEGERLSALIEDLMEIARRDSGITKTERAEIKMGVIVTRALSVVLPIAERKDIEIIVDIPDDLVAYCDETQAMQLVRNLADNAVKYTPEGGKVEVTARPRGNGIEISVKDTGIGIPHGEIERIFERFYRVDKARSRRMGGTGLGLAIVKDIVESHNGEITVDTQLGVGSVFTVFLSGREP